MLGKPSARIVSVRAIAWQQVENLNLSHFLKSAHRLALLSGLERFLIVKGCCYHHGNCVSAIVRLSYLVPPSLLPESARHLSILLFISTSI